MNPSLSLRSLLLTGLTLPVIHAGAQVLSPGLSGFQRLTLPGNSDSYLSTPFARPAAATAVVQSVTGNVITVKGVTPWSPGQFVNHGGPQDDTFYVLIVSGAGAGSSFPVSANDATSLTVDLDGGTLNAAANDRLAIIPYWTLGTLFPAGAGVHVSPSTAELRSEIILPDLNALTLAGGTPKVFYCLNGDWVEEGASLAAKNNQVLLPDSLFIVRHNIPAATEMLSNGAVVTARLQTPLGVNPSSKRDNFLGLQRPTAFTLAASGLASSGAFAASPSILNRTDELYIYDNALARLNKSPSAIYFYWNNGWRKVGGGTALFDSALLFTPGTGFMIRKSAGSIPPSWLNLPNY
ncbi:MAG TPA: TIGR02597 family protein [Verrucomicrobiales bacterium]|nr:TIGR02597 family protein [Verrucomicrobiales bacterium]